MGDVASKALGAARHRARRLLGTPQLPLSGIIHALCDEVERLRSAPVEERLPYRCVQCGHQGMIKHTHEARRSR